MVSVPQHIPFNITKGVRIISILTYTAFQIAEAAQLERHLFFCARTVKRDTMLGAQLQLSWWSATLRATVPRQFPRREIGTHATIRHQAIVVRDRFGLCLGVKFTERIVSFGKRLPKWMLRPKAKGTLHTKQTNGNMHTKRFFLDPKCGFAQFTRCRDLYLVAGSKMSECTSNQRSGHVFQQAKHSQRPFFYFHPIPMGLSEPYYTQSASTMNRLLKTMPRKVPEIAVESCRIINKFITQSQGITEKTTKTDNLAKHAYAYIHSLPSFTKLLSKSGFLPDESCFRGVRVSTNVAV